MKKLSIGLVLPDVLGTYGDDGNALVLRERARRRGIEAEFTPIRLRDAVPDDLDLYTLGGGEDVAQSIAAEHLANDGGLARAVAAGRPVLAICAGFQILGHKFRAGGKDIDGLGLIDCTTSPLEVRAIGELVTEPSGSWGLAKKLTGFENHMGRTELFGDAQPLAKVVRGIGNTGDDAGAEGATQGSILATYMHGPFLARNPEVADALLAKALGVKPSELPPLEDPAFGVIDKLREERINSKPRPRSER